MSKFEKAAWLGVAQLIGYSMVFRRIHPAVVGMLLVAAVYAGLGFYAMYCRRRDERRQKGYYVLCVTPRDSARGFLWSGPHPTEKDAHDEIADSRRLVGEKDVLYVVDKDSYPPPSMSPASGTRRDEP